MSKHICLQSHLIFKPNPFHLDIVHFSSLRFTLFQLKRNSSELFWGNACFHSGPGHRLHWLRIIVVCFGPSRSEVYKIPARVQCTVQVCELAVSKLNPPPYRSRQIICLSHSESVHLPLQLPMRHSPHQLHAGPFHPVHACTAQQHTSSHTVRCARLVHLCSR
jgi:hypothetical protein